MSTPPMPKKKCEDSDPSDADENSVGEPTTGVYGNHHQRLDGEWDPNESCKDVNLSDVE
jgi:hypothetical protein